MATMGISIAVSYWVYRHNLHASRATESSALHVNALHFLSDVVASLGILIGLVVLKLTGWLVIDAIMAFAVAVYILAISAKQVKGALLELADTQLPESEIAEIRRILGTFRDRSIEAHDLRTRRSGSTRHIDFHLVVCGQMTVDESHAVCDEIEARINEVFPRSSVNIHVEPCEDPITGCRATCETFQERSKA
jgi:cation diffusion facilitator family transporter